MKKRFARGIAGVLIYPFVWILTSFILEWEPPKWDALVGSAIGGFLVGFFMIAHTPKKRRKNNA